jgi:hypothetical protein
MCFVPPCPPVKVPHPLFYPVLHLTGNEYYSLFVGDFPIIEMLSSLYILNDIMPKLMVVAGSMLYWYLIACVADGIYGKVKPSCRD